MLLRGVVLLSLALTPRAALGDQPRPPVSLEAAILPPGVVGKFSAPPALEVRLVGAAKGVAVVTDGLSVKVVTADKKVTVSLVLAESKDEKGRLIVPSADKLGVVRLDDNEVATVRISGVNSELLRPLRAAFAGEVELTVEYEVPEAWAKRFGVAGGRLRSVASVKK